MMNNSSNSVGSQQQNQNMETGVQPSSNHQPTAQAKDDLAEMLLKGGFHDSKFQFVLSCPVAVS
jgi:hypothetical protein